MYSIVCRQERQEINQMAKQFPEKEIIVTGIPKYKDVLENGIGYYLKDPSKGDPSKIYYE